MSCMEVSVALHAVSLHGVYSFVALPILIEIMFSLERLRRY